MKKKVLLLLASFIFASTVTGWQPLLASEASETGKAVNPLLGIAIVLVFQAADLEALTGGYITLKPTGIHSTEKYFAKNGSELRLLGMSHVAEPGFYKSIKDGLRGKAALMLMEGVSDEKKLLAQPLDYANLAAKLGIENQRDQFSTKEMPEGIEIVRADLDAADFAPETVDILNSIGKVYAKDGLNMANLLMLYLKLSDSDTSRELMKDLLARRNHCLIEHLKKNLKKHNLILVPWGALHLPDIEKWVTAEGFALKEQKSRMLLRFPDYFRHFISGIDNSKKADEPVKTLSEILGI